jgi:hypothetical protein
MPKIGFKVLTLKEKTFNKITEEAKEKGISPSKLLEEHFNCLEVPAP